MEIISIEKKNDIIIDSLVQVNLEDCYYSKKYYSCKGNDST